MSVRNLHLATNVRRALAAGLALVLLVSLCLPTAIAEAATLEAGQTSFSTQAASAPVTQSDTVKMALIIEQKNSSHGDRSTFSYNKKGLISAEVDYDRQKVGKKWITAAKVYKTNSYYANGKLAKASYRTVYDASLKKKTVKNAYEYTYNDERKLTKKTWTDVKTGKKVSQSYEYDKKGRLYRVKQNNANVAGTYNWYIYSYNAKGRVASIKTAAMKKSNGKWTRVGNYKLTEKFTYTAAGRVKTITSTMAPKKTTFSYGIKSGRVTKRVAKVSGKKSTMTYKYKVVAVPRAYVAQVKAQQADLMSPIVGV